MRGYITGSTATSMWTNYVKGNRIYCGHHLPDNLIKNQKLDANLLTPTTKSDEHDALISASEIVANGLMSQAAWDTCADYAQKLFAYGQEVARSKGLILVDTKYEFGVDSGGAVLLVDELHTPDSSRYWVAETYDQRMAAGEDPDCIDKEFIRRWICTVCDPYSEEQGELPVPPKDMVNELSRRYILIYEILTGERFNFEAFDEEDSADQAVEKFFHQQQS
eukprot:gene27478-34199_t